MCNGHYVSCPLDPFWLCSCGCTGLTVLYCACLLHYWGGYERDDFTAAVHVYLDSTVTWPLPAHRTWWRVAGATHKVVLKTSLVKYWKEQCADNGESIQWEQWQGQSCVFWYPSSVFLALGKCFTCTETACAMVETCLCNTYTYSKLCFVRSPIKMVQTDLLCVTLCTLIILNNKDLFIHMWYLNMGFE